MNTLTGRLVDPIQEKTYIAEIVITEGRIASITPRPDLDPSSSAAGSPLRYILPGFIDAHVHIESSLLIPSEFARIAVTHGTIGTVSDPHEIANVCGMEGVEFMIKNGNAVPFYFNFGAPSCVPATSFETAGDSLDAGKVAALLARPGIKYLSEMMNFPGVLQQDPEVMAKIQAARALNKPVDGHAPGLRGEEARQYIAAGISTDHECFTAEEALDKLKYGMKILIREGSAARNFEALIGLLPDHADNMMFCSDDKHPDSLVLGHINQLCARAVAKGIDIYKVLKAACVNPVLHYKLDSGLLRVGDPADFILVEDLTSFQVYATYIKGQCVAEHGQTKIAPAHIVPPPPPTSGSSMLTASPINNFKARPRAVADFAYPLDKWGEQENIEQVYVIEALEGQLITNKFIAPVADLLSPDARFLQSNPAKDLLKIVVVDRYQPQAPVAKSFIKNFGLTRGALASSVAHDSHNIVAVGVDDESLCRAVNMVIEQQGGLSCVDSEASAIGSGSPASGSGSPAGNPAELILSLPVAGLMSLGEGPHVAAAYSEIDAMARSLGSRLAAPYMTLSFMALLVIPHLKLSDLGLFDGDAFKLV